jgi:hypothetical protein
LPSNRLLTIAFVYTAASLVHFIHNAEFLSDYPNLPTSWTRVGVYLAWLGMTAIGAVGLLLIGRGWRVPGLLALAVYALLGVDSLGHYVVAPFSAHTAMMNFTILLEVSAAAMLLVEVANRLRTGGLPWTRSISPKNSR